MSTTSTAQSNAFNFTSFVQNSVDPRTGQYTLGIELPELVGNDQQGPALPLNLAFNPMNSTDAGFGHGWSLNLSQYRPASNLLSLQSGETYKVTGSDQGDGTGLGIAERKIESFHFHQESSTCWRVEYKTGLVEFLELLGPTDRQVALPVRIEAASGHWIDLAYDHSYNGNPCLSSITDANATTLLTVEYDSGSVLFELFPDAPVDDPSRATYRLQLENLGTPILRLPTRIFLPTTDGACWQFEYAHLAYTETQNLALLKQVKTPMGATETIEHWQGSDGHRFPDDARPPMPRVKRHQVDPGFGQPAMVTTYAYTDTNFLGRGANGVVWRDDGLDNLYRFTGQDYEYGSTASLWLKDDAPDTPGDGKVLRTVTRRYNRFHLMLCETETQNGHVQEISTVYHEDPGLKFDRQPSYFQMPHKVTQRWKLERSDTWPREETKTSTFDVHGNLLRETEHDGTYTEYTYYEIEGEIEQVGDVEEVACPPDLQGFKRRIKYKTTYPAESTEGQATILRSHYRYRDIAPLTGARKTFGEVLIKHQRTLQLRDASDETGTLLQLSEMAYLDMPDKPLLHMRPDHHRQTMKHGDPLKDRTTTTQFFYSKIKDENGDESLLQTCQTVQGHDLAQRTLHSAVSRYCGLAMRQQDSNGVYTYTYYDALRRPIRQTVAPDKPALSATRFYTYGFSANGTQAHRSETDVQGVVSTQLLDGVGRSVRETREVTEEDEKGQSKRVTYTVQTHQYDDLGRQISQTVHDQLGGDGVSLELTSTFKYDDWGDRCTIIHPDGVIERRERSPFGKEGDIVDTWQERPDEKTPVRRQWQVTELNRFGKPEYQRRNTEDGQEAGRLEYFYDGLGRCVREVRHLRDPLDEDNTKKPLERTTRFTYDSWGRMTHHERPDKSTLVRHFADFCTDQLVTRLELQRAGQPTSPVCTRTFDGLARMKTLTVGPRTETYTYQGGQTLLHQHQRTSGRTRTYTYQPELSTEPTRVVTTNPNGVTNLDPSSFDYERPDAALTAATNAEGKRLYSYTDQGYLLREAWATQDADGNYVDEHFTEHQHSLQGRVLSRSSDAGASTVHHYDAMGRLEQTVQGELQADFEYDTDGRPCKTVTLDKHSQRTLTCLRQYDSLGRETERTLTLDDGTTQTLTLIWRDDDQLHQRIRKQDGQSLLKETFQYDQLDRLNKVEYSGTELPRNSAGRAIKSQLFRFDAMDNMTQCRTDFTDGQKDDARFTYKADDSFQLEQVTHSLHADYPACQAFSYDADGNMRNDEWGRQLHYDDLGRLTEVRAQDDQQVLARYRYDGHDHLLAVRHGNAAEVQRRYQGYRLSATLEDGVLNQYLYDGEAALAMQTAGQPSDSRLLLTDAANSVLGEYAADGVHVGSYSVYGERAKDEQLRSLLAFNGELCEPAFDQKPAGWYLLGRGYRAYNPQLMRFHSPDSLAPEISGVNPYVYALGNPVNWYDPTGHYSTGMNKPAPDYRDPVKRPKASFMEKWQNVVQAALGVLTALAFTFIAPPVGIGIAIAVVGNVVAIGGLAATVVGTLNDDPTLVAYGGLAVNVGTLISVFSMVGARFMKPKATEAGTGVGNNGTGTEVVSTAGNTLPRGSTAGAGGTTGVNASTQVSPQVSPNPVRRSSVVPPEPPPQPGTSSSARSPDVSSAPAAVQPAPAAPTTAPTAVPTTSQKDFIATLNRRFRKGLKRINLERKRLDNSNLVIDNGKHNGMVGTPVK